MDIFHRAALKSSDEAYKIIVVSDVEATDGIVAAIVGAAKRIVVIADGGKVSSQRDVGRLAESLAAGDAIGRIDAACQVAQVGIVGDGVSCSASLISSLEQIVSEGHAKLFGEGAPVCGGLILQGKGGSRDNDRLEGSAVEGVGVGHEAVALLNVNAVEVDAVLEGTLLDAGYAGGQRDLGDSVAVVDGCVADVCDAPADGDTAELLAAAEGIVANGSDVVADGHAFQVLPVPWSIGTPESVNGGSAVVLHITRTSDGQSGVLSVLLAELPCGTAAARAADIAVGHLETIENRIRGEGDGERRSRL